MRFPCHAARANPDPAAEGAHRSAATDPNTKPYSKRAALMLAKRGERWLTWFAQARCAQKWKPVLRREARWNKWLIIGRDSRIAPNDLCALNLNAFSPPTVDAPFTTFDRQARWSFEKSSFGATAKYPYKEVESPGADEQAGERGRAE